ncbi:MAG: chorismate mutase [Verrucomicrobiota bacterium]
MPAFQKKLNQFRNQIDRIDSKILRLLNQRFEVVRRVVRLKKAHQLKIYDPRREHVLLARLEEKNKKLKGALPSKRLRQIYRAIMACSRQTQKQILQQWSIKK